MGLLNQIGSGLMTGVETGLGLLGTAGEIYFAAKSPDGYEAMKKRTDKRKLDAENQAHTQGLLQLGAMDDVDERRIAAFNMQSTNPVIRQQGTKNYAASFQPEEQDPLHFFKQGTGTPGQMENAFYDPNNQSVTGIGTPYQQQKPASVRVETNVGGGPKIKLGATPPNHYQKIVDGIPTFEPVTGSVADVNSKAYERHQTKGYNKAAGPTERLMEQIDNYAELYKKTGTSLMPGADKRKLQQAHKSLVFGFKSKTKGGALDEGLIRVLSDIIPDATTANALAMSNDQMIDLILSMKNGMPEELSAFRNEFPGSSAATKYEETEEDRYNRLKSEGM